MKYEVRVGADTRSVSIERNAQGELRVALESLGPDGAGAKVFVAADILEIGAGGFSILFQGASFDTQIIPEAEGLAVFCRGREFHATVRDPRAWSRKGAGKELTAACSRRTAARKSLRPCPARSCACWSPPVKTSKWDRAW